MASTAEEPLERARTPWWSRAGYALLVLSALSLVTLFAQDVLAEIEERRGEHGELHHLFVFDLAWPVFLLSAFALLLAGLAALVAGRIRRSSRLIRFAAWALGYVSVAVVAVVLAA